MMPFGYMGKILWVDLTTGNLQEEEIQDNLYKKFLTGYGLGVKIIFDKLQPGVDPLSQENIFGMMSGLLTGSGAFFSGRWMIMGKSPLTNTWGDANCGGYFAPAIKSAGYDGIFFMGKSEKPVYLLIDGDKKSLIDATDLWGKDSNDTIDCLTNRYGAHFKTACIGPGGEKMSRISGVVTDKGRLAARSGLGAIMGSKNLKAVCLGGNKNVNIFDQQTISKLVEDFARQFYIYKHPLKDKILNEATNIPILSGAIRFLSENEMMPSISGEIEKYAMKTWGTSGTVAYSANTGDSPVKNWKGVGYIDFPGRLTQEISNDSVTKYETDKYGCYNCPLCCGGKVAVKGGSYPISETHKPEYETICGFGTMLLCNDMPSIIKINDLLNRAGIDTISCADTVAWAFEAYENKVINSTDTEGLVLTWGNEEAVVKLVEKIANGEGIGKYLMNGVKLASEHFGKGSEAYAMHVRGQELPMHDPRNPDGTSLGVGYEAEPTPGRHTSTLDCCSLYRQAPSKKLTDKNLHPMKNKCTDEAPGDSLRDASCFMDLINGFGLCAFAFDEGVTPPIIEWANAMTGWNLGFEEYLHIARRIKTLRHSFNIREGLNPMEFKMPDRARGIPPLERGPNAMIKNDFDKGKINYFNAMGYDLNTGKPLVETLDMLDLPEVKEALYK
ncbi:aldehyde ferredoxin oxidoreductase family protein [Desulfosporosinus sp. BG]|uniref:aldehyde ferredoxin oxidoreductase family protein n=1 Tax=Desulfosporosinus sp. BG TaxID=1633135 RepID=UPI00083A9C4B|nr:aldehyde ferredoxin oxidoreductase family protein [Desulfosporosinus sp. BG]